MHTQPLAQTRTDRMRLEPSRPLRTRGPELRSRGQAAADDPERGGCAGVTVAVERSATGCLLRVAGELNGTTRSLLEAILEHVGDSCGGRVELDLSDVSLADYQGLLPALSSNTVIKTASPAVNSTLRSLASEVLAR